MITKKTDAYNSLFQKASKLLNLSGDSEISTLNEYFANIRDLIDSSNYSADKTIKGGLHFTFLPLDEPTFEINANTREIAIPDVFKKNGVGVKGDQVAEIIYFEIDRYFDAVDLNTQKIYIEWETASQKGLSPEYGNGDARDVTSKENKIIFGWPLSSKITEHAGQVKFAIRFYSINTDNEIVYSFSTKPAIITINDTINSDLLINKPTEEEGITQMILDRFVDSDIDGGDNIADKPIFTYNIIDNPSQENIKNGVILNLNKSGKRGEDSLDLKVQAWGPGIISYYLETYGTNNQWNRNNEKPVQIIYVASDDPERVENKIYYKATLGDAGQVTGYMVYTDEDLPGVITGNEKDDVYEAFAIYNTKEIGKYRIVAQNRENKAKNSNPSIAVTIPAPLTPVVKKETTPVQLKNGSAELKADYVEKKDNGEYSYKWLTPSKEESVSIEPVYTVYEPGTYELRVENYLNNATATSSTAMYRVTEPTEIPDEKYITASPNTTNALRVGVDEMNIEISSDAIYDTVEVTWYKEDPNADGSYGTPHENDTRIISGTASKNDRTALSFTPTESGSYYATLLFDYNTFKPLDENGKEKLYYSRVWNYMD